MRTNQQGQGQAKYAIDNIYTLYTLNILGVAIMFDQNPIGYYSYIEGHYIMM